MANREFSKNFQAQEILQKHMNLANESIRARSLVCEAKTNKLQNAEQYYHRVKSQMQAAMPNWKSSRNSLSSSNPASNHSAGDSTASSYSYLSGAGVAPSSIADFNLQQLAEEVANARTRVQMLRMERNQERRWLEAANLGVNRLRLATEQGLKPPVSGGFSSSAQPHELHQLSSRITKLKEKLSQGEHERRHYLQELATLLQKQSQLAYQSETIPKTNCSVQTDFNYSAEGDIPVCTIQSQAPNNNPNNFGQLALLKLQYRDVCAQIEQLQQAMVLFEAKNPPREWTGQLSIDRVHLVMQLREHLLTDCEANKKPDLILRLNKLEADVKNEWDLEWERAALREQLFQALRHRNLLSEQIQSLSNTTLSSFSSESSLTSSLGSLNSLSGADIIYRMPPPYLISCLNPAIHPHLNIQSILNLPPNIVAQASNAPASVNNAAEPLTDQSKFTPASDAQGINRLSSCSSHHYYNLPEPSSQPGAQISDFPYLPQAAQPLEAEMPESEPPNYEAHINNLLRRAANRYYVNVSADDTSPDGAQAAAYMPCQEEYGSVSAAVSNESVAGDSGVFEAKLEGSIFMHLYLQLSYDYHSQVVYLHIHSIRNISIITHLLNTNHPQSGKPPPAIPSSSTYQNQEISLKLDLSPRLSNINASGPWMCLSGLLEAASSHDGVNQVTPVDQRFTFSLPVSALSQCALQVLLTLRSPEKLIGCCKISLSDLPSSGSSNAYYWFPMHIWNSVPLPSNSPLNWLQHREINEDYVNLSSCNYVDVFGEPSSSENLNHLLEQSGCEQSPSLSSSTPIYAYNNSSSSEETPVGGMTASAATFICIEDDELTGQETVAQVYGPKHSVSASQPSTLTSTVKEESREDSNGEDDSSQSDIDIPRMKRHMSVTKLKSDELQYTSDIKSKPSGSNLATFLRHLASRRGTIDQETSTLPMASFAEPGGNNSGIKKTCGPVSSPERFIKRSQTYTGEKACAFSRESSTRSKVFRKKCGSDAKGRRTYQGDKAPATPGHNSPASLNRSESDSQLITGSTVCKTRPCSRNMSSKPSLLNNVHQTDISSRNTGQASPTTHMDSAVMANLNLNLDLQALEQRLAEQAQELSNLNRLTISLQEKLGSCSTAEERVAVLEDLETREPRLCQMVMQHLQLQSHLAEADNDRAKEERKVSRLLKQVDLGAKQMRKEFTSEGRPVKITLDEKLAYFTRGMRPASNSSCNSYSPTSSTCRPSVNNQSSQIVSNIALNNSEHTSSEV